MADKPRVIVVVAPDGKVTMKVEGVSGPACLAATKHLEDSLGRVTNRRPTSEYGETEDQKEKVGA